MYLLSEESDMTSGSGFAGGVEFEETFPDDPIPDPFAHAAASLTGVATPAVTNATALDLSTFVTQAALEEQLDRRMREAEAMVKETIQELLFQWQTRFERRLEERRAAEEREAERRRAAEDERLRAWRIELEQKLHVLVDDAVAAKAADRESAAQSSAPRRQVDTFADVLANATSARDVGRLLRDRVTELVSPVSFAIAIVQPGRDDVVYRYRVAAEGELGAALRRETLDDGPESPAAHIDGWSRGLRTLRVSGRNATIHTAQLAMRVDGAVVAVLTVQCEGEAIADAVLGRTAELARAAGPRLQALRDRGSLRGV